MSDDKTNRGSPDRDRISLSEPYEVEYWTKTLGITKDQLIDIVGRVGPSADKVRAEAGK